MVVYNSRYTAYFNYCGAIAPLGRTRYCVVTAQIAETTLYVGTAASARLSEGQGSCAGPDSQCRAPQMAVGQVVDQNIKHRNL